MNKGLESSQKGFAMPIVIAIIALVVVVGGISYLATRQPSPAKEDVRATPQEETMKKDDTMMKKDTMMEYSGSVLAGKSAPLLDFTKADYDAALKTDKLVVLYFYANWCPICKAEFPVMQKVFNEISTDKVIGFRVNYSDDQTDADETALARQFGVAYQHTKVFVRNGTRILKSPEGWDDKRYDTEINRALAQ